MRSDGGYDIIIIEVMKGMMTEKKSRDCTKCIAYCNMLGGEENLCGLRFEVVEDVEGGYGSWDMVIRPRDNKCEKIFLPKTK